MKRWASVLMLVFSLFAVAAVSAGEVPEDKAALDKAVSEGKPAIVYFHATWCPNCKLQVPLVEQLLSEPRFKNVTLFLADYDKEVDLKKALGVTVQSTFVVYKGGQIVARSTAQTHKEDIAATFSKAL